jgi:sugar phosphate permease
VGRPVRARHRDRLGGGDDARASAVGDAERGTAAGLLNTAAQVGTAVGIAALVLVAGTTGATAGHRLGFAAAAVLAALGAVGVGVLLRAPARPAMVGAVQRRGRRSTT